MVTGGAGVGMISLLCRHNNASVDPAQPVPFSSQTTVGRYGHMGNLRYGPAHSKQYIFPEVLFHSRVELLEPVL